MGAGPVGVCGVLTQKPDCHTGGVGANGGTEVALHGSVSQGRRTGVPVAVLGAVVLCALVLPKVGEAREGRRCSGGPCASPSSGTAGSSVEVVRSPNGKGVLGGCFAHIRRYLPTLVLPGRGFRGSCPSSPSEDSSSEEHGEKNDRTDDAFADASSRKEIPIIGGFTASNGGGLIARTCGCGCCGPCSGALESFVIRAEV